MCSFANIPHSFSQRLHFLDKFPTYSLISNIPQLSRKNLHSSITVDFIVMYSKTIMSQSDNISAKGRGNQGCYYDLR